MGLYTTNAGDGVRRRGLSRTARRPCGVDLSAALLPSVELMHSFINTAVWWSPRSHRYIP